jgi:hypothetical protein
MRILYRENEDEAPEKESCAIYHIVKLSTANLTKRVQGEAKIADMYISDVETKFEYLLFNAPDDTSYMDLYIYFRNEWNRIMKALESRKFKYIRINKKHFDNQYAPKSLELWDTRQ